MKEEPYKTIRTTLLSALSNIKLGICFGP